MSRREGGIIQWFKIIDNIYRIINIFSEKLNRENN